MTLGSQSGSWRPRLGLRVTALAATVVVASIAVGQYSLDAGLGSSRVNAPTQRVFVSKPLYTVNHQTGEMVYNRANAFNDPTYNIYQRYTIDRTEYFHAGSGDSWRTSQYTPLPTSPVPARTSGATASRLPRSQISQGWNPGAALSHPSYSATPRGSGQRADHAGSRGGAYGHMTGSLIAPSYRVSGGGGGGRRR